MHYRICIRGHLDPSWQERFAGLRLELQEAGTTLLSGELPDQDALHGNPYRGRRWPCSSPHSCCVATASAELYTPATGTWMPTGSMNTARIDATATLLPSGQVLVAGGYNLTELGIEACLEVTRGVPHVGGHERSRGDPFNTRGEVRHGDTNVSRQVWCHRLR